MKVNKLLNLLYKALWHFLQTWYSKGSICLREVFNTDKDSACFKPSDRRFC